MSYPEVSAIREASARAFLAHGRTLSICGFRPPRVRERLLSEEGVRCVKTKCWPFCSSTDAAEPIYLARIASERSEAEPRKKGPERPRPNPRIASAELGGQQSTRRQGNEGDGNIRRLACGYTDAFAEYCSLGLPLPLLGPTLGHPALPLYNTRRIQIRGPSFGSVSYLACCSSESP